MKYLLTILALITFTAPHANAQSYGQMFESLSDLNNGNPLQDPRFDRSEEVITRKVQDKKNKVVGNVHDVLLTSRGNISAIMLDFNRLQKSEKLALPYDSSGFRGVSNAYILSLYSGDQIDELYPMFLSEMATASGDSSDIFSTKNIIGAQVKANNGEVLGVVDDVLFDRSGDRARGLYINMKKGNFRGIALAIPFDSGAFDFTDRYREITLSEAQTRALYDYADSID